MNTPGSSHSPWHLQAWSDYIARIVHPTAKTFLRQTPVRMTRRQELLAAQEKRRREHREHVLELLREVKEKNDATPRMKDMGFSSHH